MNLNIFQEERGVNTCSEFSRARTHKDLAIFHLTVVASPGGSLGADQNAGMPNPLSSAAGAQSQYLSEPGEEGSFCRH